MKLKQSVNLLLIVLFIWAFQSTTIHYQQHSIEEVSECNVCHASEQMELYQHNTPVVEIKKNLAVKTRRKVEKVIVNARFDYTETPQLKRVDIVENRDYSVGPTPLGFNATAPPVHFS